VVATDLETDFLETQVTRYPTLKVLRHDITTEELTSGFDFVHARWLVEWLPDKRLALARMAAALRPGGWLLVEEPDFVTILGSAEPPALRRAMFAGTRYLESTGPVEVEYGRRLVDDLDITGLVEVAAEGRCAAVRGGSPPAAHFLGLTLEKLRGAMLATRQISEEELDSALAALQDPSVTVVMPVTIAAWGRQTWAIRVILPPSPCPRRMTAHLVRSLQSKASRSPRGSFCSPWWPWRGWSDRHALWRGRGVWNRR
jgi:SAM-dependent methyltransferase